MVLHLIELRKLNWVCGKVSYFLNIELEAEKEVMYLRLPTFHLFYQNVECFDPLLAFDAAFCDIRPARIMRTACSKASCVYRLYFPRSAICNMQIYRM